MDTVGSKLAGGVKNSLVKGKRGMDFQSAPGIAFKGKIISGFFLFALLFLVTSCGGGGGGTASTPVAGENSVAAKTTVLPVGNAACPSGGIEVQTGIDTNGNGVLDTSEVTATNNVCNGSDGAIGSAGATGSAGAAGSAGATGSTGATGSAGPGITWVDVTGTSAQAESNKGYMADNASQVTITLPASPAVGDVVQVSGLGIGGWKIAQNAGQSIYTANWGVGVAAWTARDSARNWYSVASSSDGTKLVAVVVGGQVYTSTDSGLTWTARDSARLWYSVASSSDGTKLVAVVNGGQIYTSTDSGATWTARATALGWYSVASSSDGTKLVAAAYAGQIYTSTDSGATWTARDSARNWRSVASSSDGTKLVAGGNAGQIYTSSVTTTLGVTGFVSGVQYNAIELQYVGGGLFIPISNEGTLTCQ